MRFLFTLTVFLSSFLLFLVEPLIAKRLLPTFGGSPLVWNTSLLFFQTILLLGYLYAHSSTRRLGAKQPKLHLVVLFLGLGVLPIRLPGALLHIYQQSLARDPNSFLAQPSFMVLAMLALSVGLPFFALSSGAPLIQKWFSQTNDPNAHNPYFLYRASNVGSLIALLAYPVIIEPRFSLGATSLLWTVLYVALGMLMVLCAIAVRTHASTTVEAVAAEEMDSPAPSARKKLMWVALAAGPSAALLGLTGYLTTNVAPVPLLWVVPLSIYLITFIVAFAEHRQIPQVALRFLTPIAVFLPVSFFALGRFTPIQSVVPLHLVCFLVVALACHSQLAAGRPSARHLTEFYVWLSVGGAVGGLFASIVAPLIFTDKFEYPVSLAFCALSLGFAMSQAEHRKGYGFALVVSGLAAYAIGMSRMVWHGDAVSYKYVWIAVGGAFVALTAYRPMLNGFAVCSFVGAVCCTQYAGFRKPLHIDRSFFGTHNVRAMGLTGRIRRLVDGNTVHGAQDFDHPEMPLTYYSKHSGVGKVFGALGNEARFDRVGIVGLGIGTISAYGRPGQKMDFYELDPAIERVAEDRQLFTYLTDCKAKTHVIIGDARLRLAEAESCGYGFLVIDAFASDAIPVHLLTKEAFTLYLSKMRPDGLLAVHISNKYLKLEPVLAALARDFQLRGWIVDSTKYHKTREHPEVNDSRWIILGHNATDLGPLALDTDLEPLPEAGNAKTWTDDYSDIISVLKLKPDPDE